MGCGATKNGNYNESEYDEEIEMRNFEIEIGGYRKSLSSVLPKICIEKDLLNLNALEDFILKDFSENFLKAIQNDFFYKIKDEKKYYDAKKINLLLFLLTNDTIVNNGNIKYHDKASFIISYVKNNEEDDLNFPIQREEENFVNFIGDLFDIACIGLVDSYIKIKNVQREGHLQKIRNFKEKAMENLIASVFLNKSKTASDGLTFKDLNEKFENDKFLFTAGFLREYGFEGLKAGTAEKEKQETEMKDKK